ncbi:MAG: hypothetical protein AAB492_05070 [Patescibacteria group bacterium]
MDDRRKTIAALTLITGVVILVVVVLGVVMSSKKVLSPVPDESAIRVIFISPTPVVAVTSTAAPTKKLVQPTAKPTVVLTPTKIASPTATPKP